MFVNYFSKEQGKGTFSTKANSHTSKEGFGDTYIRKPHLASNSNVPRPDLSAGKTPNIERSITLPDTNEAKLTPLHKAMPGTPLIGSPKPLLSYQYKTNFAAELLGRKKSITSNKNSEGTEENAAYTKTAPVELPSQSSPWKSAEKKPLEKEKPIERPATAQTEGRVGGHVVKTPIFEAKRSSMTNIASSIAAHNEEVVRFKRRASSEPKANDNLVLQAQLNNLEKVVDLLSVYHKTINVNATGKGGLTPVYYAVQNGNSAMLVALLERSASPNQLSRLPDKMTPLMLAAKQ